MYLFCATGASHIKLLFNWTQLGRTHYFVCGVSVMTRCTFCATARTNNLNPVVSGTRRRKEKEVNIRPWICMDIGRVQSFRRQGALKSRHSSVCVGDRRRVPRSDPSKCSVSGTPLTALARLFKMPGRTRDSLWRAHQSTPTTTKHAHSHVKRVCARETRSRAVVDASQGPRSLNTRGHLQLWSTLPTC